MIFSRAQAFAVVLVASVLTMTTAPLFAPPAHEVCDAMRHGCGKIDALASCCCGDQSDTSPSRVASDRYVARDDPAYSVATASLAFDLPADTMFVVRAEARPLTCPPDLRILFSDLRI